MEVGIEVFCEMGKQIDVSASVDISNLSSVLSVGDMFLLLKNWRKPALGLNTLNARKGITTRPRRPFFRTFPYLSEYT